MNDSIKILEEFIKYFEAEATSIKYRRNISITVGEDDIEAIENLINRVKELEEAVDNFMQGKAYSTKQLENVNKNFIPKSKIREKIEELEEENNETYTKFLESDRGNETLSTKGKMLQGAIQVLQELLEDK